MTERRHVADTFECIGDPLLRRLGDYWLSLRAGRPMPSRRDIDPAAMPWALPYVYLVDCLTDAGPGADGGRRSEEHTSELQSLMRISYAVFCLKKKKSQNNIQHQPT